MKSLTVLLLVLVSGIAHANQRYEGRIDCQGTAQIEGAFGTKSVPVSMRLNVNQGSIAHIVTLGNKSYEHPEETSWCEQDASNAVTCYGRGYGNGPELKVTIKPSGEADSTYFNAEGMNYPTPNEANTWVMNDLNCSGK